MMLKDEMNSKDKNIKITIKRQNIFLKAHTLLTNKVVEILSILGIHEEERSEDKYISEADATDDSDSYCDGRRLKHACIKRQWEEYNRQNLYSLDR